MKTREQVQETLDNMTTNEKARCLNLMRIVEYPGTPLASLDISDLFDSYDKTNNIVIDSFIFKAYGLHYPDYVGQAIGQFLIIDPVKLDEELEYSIFKWLEDLGQVEPQLTENQ